MTGLEMRYFVLKPRGKDAYAHASRRAMKAYADAIWDENNQLSIGLEEWVLNETNRALHSEDES